MSKKIKKVNQRICYIVTTDMEENPQFNISIVSNESFPPSRLNRCGTFDCKYQYFL